MHVISNNHENEVKTLLIFSIAFYFCIYSCSKQPIIDSNEHDLLKKANQLPENFFLKKSDGSQTVLTPRIQPSTTTSLSNATCNCLLPLDTSFSVVPFTNGIPPSYRNDDGSSPMIMLPFSFCFLGQSIDSIYINNNGNISFYSPYITFSSTGFPNPGFIMLAPFWGDVDTRDTLCGLVYYKVTPTTFIIKWEQVGYFANQSDKRNTFQLIITDGSDPLIPGGCNTAFCYGEMQWTTGLASGGSGGFGGIPATVGANLGDGVNFIQFGRFDQPGYGYDGPFLANDSVDWLDSSSFIFNLCLSNVPPVPFDCNNDTVLLRVGDTTDIDISFIAPEIGQITSINVNAGGLVNLITLSNTSGNMARYRGRLVANSSNIGMNAFSVTATDDGTPAQTTTVNRVFQIELPTGIQHNQISPFVSFSPNPFSDQTTLTLKDLNGKNVSLKINDITGREVMHVEHVPTSFILEKGDLMKGIYVYQLTDGDSINEIGKIMIQ